MDDSAKPSRVYDDDEIAKILKRATELHQEEPARAARGSGLTLKELEEIAVEAGINPANLRRAAQELDAGGAVRSPWIELLGEDLSLVFERVVPGEIGDRGFEDVVAVLQQGTFDHGQPNLLGRTLTWQTETPTKTRSLQVVVSSRDGETHIRVEERLHQLAGGLFGGITAGVGAGVGVGVGLPVGIVTLGSALFAVAFPLGIATISFIGARAIYRAVVAHRRKILGDLLERVSRAVADNAAPPDLARPADPPSLPAS